MATLSTHGEAEWRRAKDHLELSEGFCLCFIFSSRPEIAAVFRQRLSDIAKTRITKLQHYEPQNAKDLAETILPRILNPPRFEEDTHAPVWLDLASQTGDEWNAARMNLLARINEQREPLRNRLTRPLILVLPLRDKKRIRELVPDLWSIRSFVIEIDESFAPRPDTETVQVDTRRNDSPLPLSSADAAAIAEWERVKDKDTEDRGVLLAASRAFDALYKARRLRQARTVAEEMLTWARAAAKKGETPESLRDLSISLDNVGKTDMSLGKYEEARRAFNEGLEIGRRLSASFQDQVEYSSLEQHFENRLTELDEERASR